MFCCDLYWWLCSSNHFCDSHFWTLSRILVSCYFILSPVQTNATLLANNSQHLLDVTCCVRLHTLLHVVAYCCMLLGVAAQSLKPVKLLATCKRTQQLPTLLGQPCSELLRPFSRSFRLYWCEVSSSRTVNWIFSIYVEQLLSFKYKSLRFELLDRVLTFVIKPTWEKNKEGIKNAFKATYKDFHNETNSFKILEIMTIPIGSF